MSPATDRARPRVRAPKRRLSREAEQALTPRQLEILDALEDWLFRGGFAEATMADVARRLACSLRTLYGIAPSKDELVLIVLDRRLHRIGREAIDAMTTETTPLEKLRAYLRATNLAVQPTTAAFTREFARVAGAPELNAEHADYVVAMTRRLLEAAIEAGEIAPVHVPSTAHLLGGLGYEFARAEVAGVLDDTPQKTADALAEIVLAGLVAQGPRG